MSVRYIAVNWNRQKRIYDALLGAGIVLSLGVFGGVTALVFPDATFETILIRGLGFTGFLLLQLIVLIGPLARLEPRLLPLLYNRRHLGVAMALVALAHAAFSVVQYHAVGDTNPLVSLLTANPDLGSASRFPFELLGLVALVILVLMAATSHDFWLSALTPPAWKALHMLVYLAYAALVAHVALGVLQDETNRIYPIVLAVGALATVGLHLVAGSREVGRDRPAPSDKGWVDLGRADTIPDGRARVGVVSGERVAVFRHGDRLSCVSNVCRHQNGPLGEGKIVDGCITCPWHGYQYQPETGTSPPPFTDKIPTYNLRLSGGRVWVDERPNPPGTRVEPVVIEAPAPTSDREFYLGYLTAAPPATARLVRRVVVLVFVLVGSLQAAFALAQRGYDPSRFEFGTETTVGGTIRAKPYPMLEVARPHGGGSASRYLLALGGKHGAAAKVAGLDGRSVRIRGPLAYRDNLTLIEIASLEPVPTDSTPAVTEPTTVEYGTFELSGEVVDSKCYLGVMNPGRGKTHRGCAARCLSGGLTPLFAMDDGNRTPFEMLLVTSRGEPFPQARQLAGRPITLRGRVVSQGDLWLFFADPTSRKESR